MNLFYCFYLLTKKVWMGDEDWEPSGSLFNHSSVPAASTMFSPKTYPALLNDYHYIENPHQTEQMGEKGIFVCSRPYDVSVYVLEWKITKTDS